MDLTQGAIEAIQKPVREAEQLTKSATFVDVPGDVRRKMLVQASSHEFVEVPPPPRSHSVNTLQDLVSYCDKYSGVVGSDADEEDEAGPCSSVIWHNEERVVLVLDDHDRRDVVTLTLKKSAPWKILERIGAEDAIAFDQKDFIRLLRTKFEVSDAIIAEFRKLDFRVITTAGGNLTKNRESLGRSIESEVQTGAPELREELDVEAAIYTNPLEDRKYRLRLLLDYDHQAAKIIVSLQVDALNRCVLAHQAEIDSRCREGEAEVAVYFGTP